MPQWSRGPEPAGTRLVGHRYPGEQGAGRPQWSRAPRSAGTGSEPVPGGGGAPAAMEPRSEERGNLTTAWHKWQQSMPQWSRAPRSAGTCQVFGLVVGPSRAAMEPRSEERGNRAAIWRCRTSAVVISDSMRPRLKPGDVVLDDPHRTPKAGQVILFHDPADARRIVVHRVREVRPDGSMVTAGDANASRDSTPVPKQFYIGLGRLRVPWVGLPVLWWSQGRYQRVGAIGAGLVVVAGLASLRPRR
ncbi:MAG: Signal peptidase complex catalytic subunit [Massilia sp.]|nr:Signal peptidase complex catalytic subunit [Massilia sp.]